MGIFTKKLQPAKVTVQTVLTLALKEVGYAETPVNQTKYGKHYGMNGAQWCGLFVNWILEKSGFGKIGTTIPNTIYTPAGVAGFKKRGQLHTTGKIIAGDVLYFNFPNDNLDRVSHVGFAVATLKSGKILSIEGNTVGPKLAKGDERNGGEVAIKERNRQDIVCWGRPAYVEAPAPIVGVIISKLAHKPAVVAVKPVKPTIVAKPVSMKPKFRSVKVLRGDTLSALALKYGTTVSVIKKDNGLDSDLIKPTQILMIRK